MNRKIFLSAIIVLCLSSVGSAQEYAGHYIGPWPWLFAPTVVRDPNLHRPTVQYYRPKAKPSPQVVINNYNQQTNAAPAPSSQPTTPPVAGDYYPVSGPTIHIQFGPAPVAPAAPKVNRYR